MKTKSMIYARIRNGIVLLAVLAAVPVSAQVKFASQNSYSFSKRDKTFPTSFLNSSFLNYYSTAEANSPRSIGSAPLPSSLPAKDNTIAGEINFITMTDEPANSPLSKRENKVNIGSWKILFRRTSFTYPVSPGKDIGIAEYSAEQLMLYAISLKQYAKKNGFDTTYAFFSNMGMLNNKNRFFVVNLVTMQIEQSGLVAQGRGMGASRFDKQYSNKKDSKCTSLGRYKLMKKYKGEYGTAYKMIGLDSSNCNAYKRSIVLHSMGCMPDKEEKMPVCISEGCPAVSVKFLSSLTRIIDSRKKPVLLWIFDSNLEEIIVEQKPVSPVAKEPVYMEEKIFHRCSIHQVDRPSY